MPITIATYVLLLIIFFIISALILRYSIKFDYLNPRFKYAVGSFALLAAFIIVFSVYLLTNIETDSSSSNNSSSNSGDLNF